VSTTIKYTAVLDDNPFAAGIKRVGELLEGMRSRFTDTSSHVGAAGQAISGHMRAIASSVSSEVIAMGGHFSSLLESIGATRLGMMGLVAAAAGLAASKAVSASAHMTEGAMDLARAMGTSTNVAQQWRLALEDVDATEGELFAATKGLARQLKENEQDLQAMGLATRDAAGNLRPMNDLLLDSFDILNQYREGADRALAAQTLFGRGLDASSKLLLVNNETLDEAKATMEELGLEVGSNAVQAWKEYDAATDRAGFSIKGLGNTVGQILMPVMTDLVNLFNAIMPAAITVVKGALGGLVTAFHALRNGVVVVWETINATVVTVAEPIRALAEAVARAMVGDFKGAGAAISGIGPTIANAWSNAMDNMAASSQKTRDRIDAIWSADTGAGQAEGQRGDKSMKAPQEKQKEAPREKAAAADPSFMQYYEAALAEEKRLAAEKDALREYSKEQELAYWRTLLESADLVGKDRVAITKKVADLEVQILREQAKTRAALDQEAMKLQQDRALGAVEIARQEAQGQYKLGEISYAQLLELERKYEEQSTEIKRQGLLDKLALIDPERDPVAYAQTSAQIEALQREHQARLKQISLEQQLDAKDNPITRIFQGVQQSMQTAIEAMLQGQMSLKQGITAIWAGIRGAIVKEIANIIAKKVAGYAAEKALALAGIGADSAKAASGAAASQASIPYVGPSLALAAMAAMLAAVGGMASKVPSAARGWDIPAGLNPLTQLHEQEMVLPAEHANAIRAMTASGGASRPIEIKAVPMPGNFFMMHRDALTSALQELRRDGSISLS
jgi:hypothetical protein